jgi:hypothetical protein
LKEKILLCALVALLAFVAMPATADTLYDVQWTSTPAVAYQGSAVFDVSGGVIVGITGTQNGEQMTLLGQNVFASNDNVFSPNSPWVSENGVSFSTSSGDYNIYYFATTEGGYAPTGCAVDQTCDTMNATGDPSVPVYLSVEVAPEAVPEPGTMSLLGSGGGLIGFGLLIGKFRGRFIQR